MTRALPRGQAAAEFALGLLVFITILMFGIHFAEVGYLSAKVHEAAAAAVWDATAYRTYTFGATADSSPVAATVAANATARYADWDGRASHNAASPQMALTKAEPIAVTCSANAAVAYPLEPLAPNFGGPANAGPTGVTCGAQGDYGFGVMRFPTRFLEGPNGFFKAQNNGKLSGAASPTTLCGAGRATGGACLGTLAILLGDDALTDGTEANRCELRRGGPPGSCSNPRFYSTTLANWNKSMGYTGRPEQWASAIVPGVPSYVTGFFLSFRGEEDNFREPIAAELQGGNWQSSPMDAQLAAPYGSAYRTAYTSRQACSASGGGYCFLGKFPCN